MWPVDSEILRSKGFDIITVQKDTEPSTSLTFNVQLTKLIESRETVKYPIRYEDLCKRNYKVLIFLNGLEAHKFQVEKYFKEAFLEQGTMKVTIEFDFQLHLGDKVAVGIEEPKELS